MQAAREAELKNAEQVQVVINKKPAFTTPMAILTAGVLIAAAVFLSNGKISPQNNDGTAGTPKLEVRDDDHVQGDLSKAEVIIFEYSDSECPFCEQFLPTLKQMQTEFGDKLALVYRHFPLTSLHPYAYAEALALECAADLGGKAAVFPYLDKLFATNLQSLSRSNPEEVLYDLAQQAGMDRAAFKTCVETEKFAERVQNDAIDAQSYGAQGTPFSIVVNKKGKQIAIPGAYPVEQVRTYINSLLTK